MKLHGVSFPIRLDARGQRRCSCEISLVDMSLQSNLLPNQEKSNDERRLTIDGVMEIGFDQ